MTTEGMLEDLIQLSLKAYKKNSRGCKEWLQLSRHETVIIDGIPFNYWREYAVYKVCEWLNDKGIKVECNLDGNNSSIIINVNEEEQRVLNNKLFVLINKWGK